MIDVDKVQLIAQSYSPQELFAATTWKVNTYRQG